MAQARCTGDRALLDVAVRLADHLVHTFGEDRRHDVDGHPVFQIEPLTDEALAGHGTG